MKQDSRHLARPALRCTSRMRIRDAVRLGITSFQLFAKPFERDNQMNSRFPSRDCSLGSWMSRMSPASRKSC